MKVLVILAWSRLLIKVSSFKKLAVKMGSTNEVETFAASSDQMKKAHIIGRMIKSGSAYMPFRTLCFEQALTAALLLREENIPYRIHFGMRKNWSEAGQMKAHAWLVCGDEIITGKKGHRQHEVLSTFYFNPSQKTGAVI